MIADLVTAGMCGTALVLFGRGIYHSGVLASWIVQGISAKAPPPRPPAPPEDPWEAYCRKAEAAEQALFLETGMWWLDPNRWGDNPNWRENLPRPAAPPYLDADPPIPALAPRCPVCGPDGQVAVMAVHGGEVSMWDCLKCGAEFTRRGETRKSRKARLAREAAVQREIEALAAAEEAKRLPCGCTGDVVTRAYPTGGWDMGRYAECKTCRGTWDYAEKYGESGNPRRMHPRSGPVEWPNGA